MKKGTKVRMTSEFKLALRDKCGIAGQHLGPFENNDAAPGEDMGACYGCSSEHVDEFGECVGIVIGLVDYNNVSKRHRDYDPTKIGPEVDVRWSPSDLRYAYHPHSLEIV